MTYIIAKALPILIVKNAGGDGVALRRAVRNAHFNNPLICIPDNEAVKSYLGGAGIYANRRKFPFPALVLQDVTLPKPNGEGESAWLEKPQRCRYVMVTVMSGVVEPWHFESVVAFGPNTSLCKLQLPDSMAAMLRVLQRACIED